MKRTCHLALVALFAFVIAPSRSLAAEVTREPVTAILGAMPVEVKLLEAQLQGKRSQQLLGVTIYTGTLKGRKVVLAASGVGKVNAAVTTTLLLDHFQPTEVLFTGVAGGINPELSPGDIVLGEKTTQHDFGEVTVQGYKPGATEDPRGKPNPRFFPGAAQLLSVAEAAAKEAALDKVPTTQGERLPRVRRGVIVTGDVFVASPTKNAELRQNFGADAVEMEGAAVAQVCWQQNVPCLVIRCISDKADVMANEDFRKFVNAAAGNSAKLTLVIVERLAKSSAEPASAR
jgi:adenosylhomocysteine nucleosidase